MFRQLMKTFVQVVLIVGTTLGILLCGTMILVQPTRILAINEDFIRDVNEKLRNLEQMLRVDGYTMTNRYVEAIRDSSTRQQVITTRLRAGVSYEIRGVCDRDCTDMDLKVYDGNDTDVGTDVGGSSLPRVTIIPRWTGEFKIVVTTPSCSKFPCYYGVGIFGR